MTLSQSSFDLTPPNADERARLEAGLTEEELRDILEETLQREVANVHQGGTP